MSASDVVTLPPFPALSWTGDFWEGFAPRPSVWQQLRVASERLRGGETTFMVVVPQESMEAPSVEQVDAYRAFLGGGEPLMMRVLDAVLAHYGVLRARWLTKDPTLDLPVAERALDLVTLTQLSVVYVHKTVQQGQVHLGIALRAGWDQEHGAGVLLHGDRIVRVGMHDDAMFEPAPARRISRSTKKVKPTAKKAEPTAKNTKPKTSS